MTREKIITSSIDLGIQAWTKVLAPEVRDVLPLGILRACLRNEFRAVAHHLVERRTEYVGGEPSRDLAYPD